MMSFIGPITAQIEHEINTQVETADVHIHVNDKKSQSRGQDWLTFQAHNTGVFLLKQGT